MEESLDKQRAECYRSSIYMELDLEHLNPNTKEHARTLHEYRESDEVDFEKLARYLYHSGEEEHQNSLDQARARSKGEVIKDEVYHDSDLAGSKIDARSTSGLRAEVA